MNIKKIYSKIIGRNYKNIPNNVDKLQDKIIINKTEPTNEIELENNVVGKPKQIMNNDSQLTPANELLLGNIKNINISLYDSMKKLNHHQLESILTENKRTLVSAMVGSGKTTVLIHKVLYLHFIENVPLKDMTVLTFTNKAANEIKERIYSFYMQINGNNDYPELPYFGTFHSVARNLLINNINLKEFGYTNDFTILDTGEKKEFYLNVIDELGLDIKYKNKIEKRINNYKDLLNHHKSKTLYGNMKYEDDIEKLIEAVIEKKKQHNVMDFDDLIIYVNMLLDKPKNKLELKWVIVDEFQDSNQQQIDLISNLIGETTSVFVVGDQNQLIYSWRGSNLSLFNYFKKDDCEIYHLPINYRSTLKILDVARCFIGQDEAELSGIRKEGNSVRLVNHYDSNQEAIYLANTIKAYIKKGVPLREVAILVRTNAQLNIFETVFTKEGVPFILSTKNNINDLPVINWFISLLKASLNKQDINSVYKLFCHEKFGIIEPSALSLKKFVVAAPLLKEENGILKFCKWSSDLINNKEAVIELSEKINSFECWLEGIKPADVSSIFNYYKLEKYLNPTSSEHAKNIESIKDFLMRLKQYVELSTKDTLKLSILDALNDLILGGTNSIDEAIDPNSEKVKILTMHAAKGLEFSHVFISGANQGLVPLLYKFTDQAQLDEEKRLFFVALTRAKDFLEISYHTCPEGWNSKSEPSVFISDIPQNLIEHIVSQKPTETSNSIKKETPLEKLDNWKTMQLIKHPKYGNGVILHIDSKNITCDFEKFGSKSFSVNFLPIIPADEDRL